MSDDDFDAFDRATTTARDPQPAASLATNNNPAAALLSNMMSQHQQYLLRKKCSLHAHLHLANNFHFAQKFDDNQQPPTMKRALYDVSMSSATAHTRLQMDYWQLPESPDTPTDAASARAIIAANHSRLFGASGGAAGKGLLVTPPPPADGTKRSFMEAQQWPPQRDAYTLAFFDPAKFEYRSLEIRIDSTWEKLDLAIGQDIEKFFKVDPSNFGKSELAFLVYPAAFPGADRSRTRFALPQDPAATHIIAADEKMVGALLTSIMWARSKMEPTHFRGLQFDKLNNSNSNCTANWEHEAAKIFMERNEITELFNKWAQQQDGTAHSYTKLDVTAALSAVIDLCWSRWTGDVAQKQADARQKKLGATPKSKTGAQALSLDLELGAHGTLLARLGQAEARCAARLKALKTEFGHQPQFGPQPQQHQQQPQQQHGTINAAAAAAAATAAAATVAGRTPQPGDNQQQEVGTGTNQQQEGGTHQQFLDVFQSMTPQQRSAVQSAFAQSQVQSTPQPAADSPGRRQREASSTDAGLVTPANTANATGGSEPVSIRGANAAASGGGAGAGQ